MTERHLSDEALFAADEILEALELFSIEDERVFDAVPEYDESVTTPRAAVASFADRSYSATDGLDATEKTDVLRTILAWSDRSITTDHTYHHKRTLEGPLDDRLGDFGYGFEFRSIGVDEWVEPDSTHPRAFRFVVTDDETGTSETAAFRYPPNENARTASNQFMALAAALNDTVFSEIGLQMCYLPLGSDSYNWLVISRDRFAELESEYGENLAIWGDPLIRRRPKYGYSWKQISESPTLDHADAFTVPEPDDVYKVEEEYDVQNPTTQQLW